MIKRLLKLLVLCFLCLISGFCFGVNSIKPKTQVIEVPVYYLDEGKIQQSRDHIRFLNGLLDEYYQSREEKAKRIVELEDKIAELSIKVALYEAETNTRIEVRSGR